MKIEFTILVANSTMLFYYKFMKNIREIIGENLANLRKDAKLTQLELAEKFNYSDKSISKWEKGETLPDIIVLNELCEYYGVTLDYLTHEQTPETAKKFIKRNNVDRNNKITITALTMVIPWMVATIIYVWSLIRVGSNYWECFVWPTPLSFLILAYMNHRYFKSRWIYFISNTGFLWSLITCVYLQVLSYNVWPLFLIGIPVQIILILLARIKK